MRTTLARRGTVGAGLLASAFLLVQSLSAVQPPPAPGAPVHARAARRLIIRNAMVIYGNGKPAFGPVDIVVQDGLIARVGTVSPKDPPPDAVIDATGKYVMPGIVNTHMHLQDERGGVPQPFQYEMNLYLAAGATTVRDMGSDFVKAKQWRAASASHQIAAPRILIYTQDWRSKGDSRDAVREGLAAVRGFPGATGDLAFDARREVTKPLFYLTVEKGAVRELTPQELAAPGPGGS